MKYCSQLAVTVSMQMQVKCSSSVHIPVSTKATVDAKDYKLKIRFHVKNAASYLSTSESDFIQIHAEGVNILL